MADSARLFIEVVGDDEDVLLAMLRSERELWSVALRPARPGPGELGVTEGALIVTLTSIPGIKLLARIITQFLRRTGSSVKIRMMSPTGTTVEVPATAEVSDVESVLEKAAVVVVNVTGGGNVTVGRALDYMVDGYSPPRPPILEQTSSSTLPVTIYLSNEEAHEQVEAAVEQVLTAAGLRIESRDDPILGSWFRRMWATVTKKARTPAGQEALLIAAHATETRLVLASDADVTSKLLQGVGPVIKSLESTEKAVVRLGNVLIVKDNGVVTVSQLTPRQQFLLNHHPELACSPQKILAALNEVFLNEETSSKATVDRGDFPPALQ